MELLWENGQIVTHSTVSNYKASIPSTSLIQVPAEEGNHIVTNGDDQMGLVGKGLLQTAQLPCSDQTTTNINQEQPDEMNPSTLDCPVVDIYMELFSQVSGIDLDDSLSLTVLSAKDSERCLEGRESLFQEQCQTFMSSSRPKDHPDVTIGANLNRCGNGDLPATKLQQTQDPASGKHPSSSAPLMDFSHFSRLAAQVGSNFEFMDGMSNSSETACAPARGGRSLMGPDSDHSALFHGQMPSSARSKQDLKLLPADQHHAKMAVSFQNSEPVCWEDDARHAGKHNDQTDSTANLRMPAPAADDVSGHGSSFQGRRSVLAGKNQSEKPVLTTSPSMCSANVVAGASPIHDVKSKAKWKTPEGEASEYRAEDCEDDSASTIRKPITRKSASIKRSRGVGSHSFSERRRRDRINEKIRALRRLIPNCSKVDKATTLNEAIEYLRALQMQLQIMSMYGGLHMMPVMLSSGTPPMGMGFNMGMGFGMGMLEMAGPSMLPMPHMQGPVLHPYGSIPRTGGLLHGMPASTNLEMFGQGSSPMSIPHPTASMAPSAPVSKKKVNHAPEVPEQPEDGAAADHRPTRW